ncbi:hypothetical protein AB0N38_30240 [Micromonospora aurantiaca]|uniref:hypothetical protein n=1 Tax=Micromonospora aurantiaca (nom. illeg.) TaxID=47850 RepID=UPI001E5BB96D|nr:hypothetical protein [Micromonospora aurantiaca]UFN92412.1 hypothetical protein LF814_20640 [Micromonospora aurantiaca]
MIEVQKLAERIEAELASGRADDADVSDEQAGKIVEVLRPSPPVELATMARRAVRSVRRTAAYVAAGPLVPTFAAAVAAAGAVA